eukprot:1450028-Rhodomonas_salina.1
MEPVERRNEGVEGQEAGAAELVAVFECAPNACAEGGNCTQGRQGPVSRRAALVDMQRAASTDGGVWWEQVCGQCVAGYGKLLGGCLECPTRGRAIAVKVLLGGVLLAGTRCALPARGRLLRRRHPLPRLQPRTPQPLAACGLMCGPEPADGGSRTKTARTTRPLATPTPGLSTPGRVSPAL